MMNWFPGHMKKALNELTNIKKIVNLVFFLVDSRAPYTTFNKEVIDLLSGKQIVIVFAKSDLANQKKLEIATKYYQQIGFKTLALYKDSKRSELLNYIDKCTSDVTSRINKKRLLIVGVPNVGKSTLINKLAKSSTKVENKAGVTRGYSIIKLTSNIELIDSPGILMKKWSESEAKIIQLLNIVNEKIIDFDSVDFLLDILIESHYEELVKRYNISTIDKITIYETIMKKYGRKSIEDTKYIIYKDFNNGIFKRVSLE